MATIDSGSTDFANTDISGRAYGILLASIICPAIALIFIALRSYVRLFITHSMRFDDWIAVLTLCSNIAYSVTQGLAAQPYIGLGQQESTFDPSQAESTYYEWVYIFDTLYILSLLGYKTTILLLYLRVFGIRHSFKWWCFVALFVVDGYLVASLFAQLLGCLPPHKFWNKDIEGYCIDYLRFDIAYGCLNIITDFMITILPLREIWRLFMPIKEKMWASMIFGSAFIALGTAVVSQCFRLEDLFSDDRTYRAAVTFVWQTIEINTGLICSCTPTIRPLWIKAVSTIQGSYKSSNSSESPIVQKIIEREEKGKPLDGETLHETSPDATRRHDIEKGAHPNNIGMAISGDGKGNGYGGHGRKDGRTDDGGKRPYIPSHIYATPLPSDLATSPHQTHPQLWQSQRPVRFVPIEQADERPDTAMTDQLTALPEIADTQERGRVPQQRSTQPETKRLSQAELERMLREANAAQSQLEREAERSQQHLPQSQSHLQNQSPMPAPVQPPVQFWGDDRREEHLPATTPPAQFWGDDTPTPTPTAERLDAPLPAPPLPAALPSHNMNMNMNMSAFHHPPTTNPAAPSTIRTVSDLSVLPSMLDPMPPPVSPVPSSSLAMEEDVDAEMAPATPTTEHGNNHSHHDHGHDHSHGHSHALGREDSKKARKKKSCDLEKGVGLRI